MFLWQNHHSIIKLLKDLLGYIFIRLLKGFKLLLDLVPRLAHKCSNQGEITSILMKISFKLLDFLLGPYCMLFPISLPDSFEFDFTSGNVGSNCGGEPF